MAYKKSYAPKSKAEVAGANDHLWADKQKWPEDKRQYDINYKKAFGHD